MDEPPDWALIYSLRNPNPQTYQEWMDEANDRFIAMRKAKEAELARKKASRTK